MCGQYNVRASAGDSTEQNTDKGHTLNPRTGIKIPDPAGNGTRAAVLEGRDSTDHATATDNVSISLENNIFCQIRRTLELYCSNVTILSEAENRTLINRLFFN